MELENNELEEVWDETTREVGYEKIVCLPDD